MIAINFGLILGTLSLRAGMASAQSVGEGEALAQGNAHTSELHSDLLIISFPIGGFYLVSLPMAVQDSSVSTLFPMALGAFSWERDHYEQAATIARGRGYWLAIPGPSTAVISGTPLKQFKLHCFPGFNLIGSVLDSVDFSNPNDTPDGSVFLPAFRWITAEGRYEPITFLEQSYGHWIAVLQECDIIVEIGSSGAMAKSVGAEQVQSFYKRFGTAPPPPPFVFDPKLLQLLPTQSKLSYNYPNPFNPETVIRYTLPKNGLTRVSIYNALGQKVRTLIDQEQQAGVHEVRWDGRDTSGQLLGAGVYFYRLVGNGFSETKKMILMR
jgi:hypothetical protein